MKISGKLEQFLNKKCCDKFGVTLNDFVTNIEKTVNQINEVAKKFTMEDIIEFEKSSGKKALKRNKTPSNEFLLFLINKEQMKTFGVEQS